MKRRSQQDWLALVQKFESSGQTQIAFCKAHALNSQYFSLRRSRLLNELKPTTKQTPFVRAQSPTPQKNHTAMTLQVGGVSLDFATIMPAATIVKIIKGLT